MLATSDEAVLVERTQAGDRESFGQLVSQNMKRAFAIAYRILHDRQDAEDVVQEGFMAALSAIDTFDLSRPFGPWLGRIVARKALNAVEKRRVRTAEPLSPELAERGVSPSDYAARSQLSARIRLALQKLPQRQRSLIELVELEGFSAAETADLLGISGGTARWHLHEARGALRELLGEFR